MKYSNGNKPLVCMMTNSTCYKGTRTMTIKGILWHSTGANNPNLKRYVQPSSNDVNYSALIAKIGKNANGNDWNHITRQAGVNAWIGKLADGSVATVQTMPWNYRPWGCGSGSKGSCNDNFIQFEIAEDSLTDKSYFEKVYKEACELTAYLCTLYNLDPKGTTTVNGVKVPVILCHQDSYKFGLGSNHSDVYHWFNKYGKDMDDVRNDVYNLMHPSATKPAASGEIYRVRKTWADASSQIGAYGMLENAKKACDKAGAGYYVFNSAGVAVYPVTSTTRPTLKSGSTGDDVKVLQNRLNELGYSCGTADGIFGAKTVFAVKKFQSDRGLTADGIVGAKTWEELYSVSSSYKIKVTVDALNIRSGPGTGYKITGCIRDMGVYTITDTKNGWGFLKSGAGWISLEYTQKV